MVRADLSISWRGCIAGFSLNHISPTWVPAGFSEDGYRRDVTAEEGSEPFKEQMKSDEPQM